MAENFASDQFSLRWNNFSNNLTSGFLSHLGDKDLVDVTLAVDGRLMQAHKLVLSVCSPYFKDIFKCNPCQHPVVILKDMGYAEVEALLKFMYQGEVNVKQDELASFLKVAETLQIKGLTGVEDSSQIACIKQEDDLSFHSETIKSEPDSDSNDFQRSARQAINSDAPVPKRRSHDLSGQATTHSSKRCRTSVLKDFVEVPIVSPNSVAAETDPLEDGDNEETRYFNKRKSDDFAEEDMSGAVTDDSIDLTKDDTPDDKDEQFITENMTKAARLPGDNPAPEILEAARNVSLDLLPEKSKRQYIGAYNEFSKWRVATETTSFTEEVLLVYFEELSRNLQPSTLWSRYSMLRATIKTYDDIDISAYRRLINFLKKKSSGHKGKKSKVFTPADVYKYCNEAPDEKYLGTKVALIIGITGACRREELCNMTTNDIEDHNTMLLIKIPRTKTGVQRSFTVVGEFYKTCKKYMNLRPKDSKTNRFFLNYQHGKCTQQAIGINKFGGMPKEIATYLKLREPELYTGHSFRRTSATLLADAGADITSLKRHGGWKSSAAAEGSIEDPLSNQTKICEQIINTISLHASTFTEQAESAVPAPKELTPADEEDACPSTSTSALSCFKGNEATSLQFNKCSVTIQIQDK